MVAMERVEVEWTGTTGLPGVSVLYGEPGTPSLNSDVLAFFDSIKTLIPAGTSIFVPSSGDLIEDSDGSLAGTWSNSSGGTVACTGAGSWPAGTGARVVWRTNGIRNRRRVIGSPFIAPLVAAAFESNGTIAPASLTTLRTAATALAAGGRLLVWSRPTTVAAADGASNSVLNATVPDQVTSLRSRRR